jgi:ABC-type antimicrobial peptide transport system permease subunit
MIAARVSGDMTSATNALRSIAARADVSLRTSNVQPLDQVKVNGTKTAIYVARLFTIVSLSALVLALSGIYAVMSFAVSRRTREIGIRMALGASPPRVVLTILRLPLIQTALGIAVGGALTFLWLNSLPFAAGHALGTAGYILAMVGVCLLACVAPARRALNVDPIAALRND